MVRPDIEDFLKTIPNDVTVVAASKYVDAKDVEVLLSAGINQPGINVRCICQT